jgi:hypothetical protein
MHLLSAVIETIPNAVSLDALKRQSLSRSPQQLPLHRCRVYHRLPHSESHLDVRRVKGYSTLTGDSLSKAYL